MAALGYQDSNWYIYLISYFFQKELKEIYKKKMRRWDKIANKGQEYIENIKVFKILFDEMREG